MDDCDAIVSKDNERLFLTGMPPIVQGLRLLRKLGVGIGLGAGAMSPVSEQILNSVTYQFVFKNPHDDNASAAKRTLWFISRQRDPHSDAETGRVRRASSGALVTRNSREHRLCTARYFHHTTI